MTFLARTRPPSYEDRALEAWRTAADLVHEQWDQFLVADRKSRPAAFAAYVAALELEEAAAGELASLSFAAAA
jgi:hypothetical protein